MSTTNDRERSASPRPRRSHTLQTPKPLTARQQDAQARNKDPYSEPDSPQWQGNWNPSSNAFARYDASGMDSYESQALRRKAAIVLDNPELLMMYALARNDSIPGTRYYFAQISTGYLTSADLENAEDLEKQDKEEEKQKAGKSTAKRYNIPEI
ncbi:hypothetical protein BJ878DRAFT_537792 [Calycina marina]|uniref:Uncharacterized protein n=1 Tax=Calycina marina TaxID=1763456 RepID=A0A9P7ZBU4_9HELO|nr:hypothetical protein BJ878DRAFT_537792 [Calycina marina]